MEIINSNAASLCNYEVLLRLQKVKESKKKQKGQLATITYETLRHLDTTPCKEQTSESITQFIADLKPYNLSKSETLMMVNSPPATALEIQLMVEESEERLSEEQVQEIIAIAGKHFPHIIKEVPEEDNEEEEAAE